MKNFIFFVRKISVIKKRNYSIDTMKGLLVISMILAHVIQFLGKRTAVMSEISQFVNLITFSGFFFCFGYVFYVAYLSKTISAVWKRILKTSFKTLVAFYISGICYCAILKRGISESWILKILLLEKIPGYSEFLISFALVSLVGLIFFIPLQKLLKHKWLALGGGMLLLLTTFIPYQKVTCTQLGLLIGTKKFAAFPVLQYFPLWLAGAFFAKYKIKWNRNIFVTTFWCSVTYLISKHFKSPLLVRFSPSALWIISPLFFIYCYYLSSNFFSKYTWTTSIIKIGQNTLFYLLSSNIIIFILTTLEMNKISLFYSILLTILILFIIKYFISIITFSREGEDK